MLKTLAFWNLTSIQNVKYVFIKPDVLMNLNKLIQHIFFTLHIYLQRLALQIEIHNLLVNLFSSGLLTKLAIKIYLYILSLYVSRCHFLNLKIDCMCCIKCLWAGEEGDILSG